MYALKRREAVLRSKFDLIGNEILAMNEIWHQINTMRDKIISKIVENDEDFKNKTILDTFFDQICDVLPYMDQFLTFLDEKECSQLIDNANRDQTTSISRSMSLITIQNSLNDNNLVTDVKDSNGVPVVNENHNSSDVTENADLSTVSSGTLEVSTANELNLSVNDNSASTTITNGSHIKHGNMKSLHLLPRTPTSNHRNDVAFQSPVLNNFYKSPPPLVLNKRPDPKEIENSTFPDVSKPIDVMISHFRTPSDFHVQLIDSKYHLLKRLEDQLKAAYDKSAVEFETKAAVKKLNKKYFVWYDIRTSNWYRVEIIDYLNHQDSNYVRVFAFDFGFTDKTSVFYLRTFMNVQFYKFKKFAIRCYMKNIFPYQMKNIETCSKIKWPRYVMKYIREMFEDYKSSTYIEVLNKTADNNTYAVDLIINDQYLDEHLIKSKMATKIDDESGTKNGILCLKKVPPNDSSVQQSNKHYNSDDSETTISDLILADMHDDVAIEVGTDDVNIAVANLRINDEADHCRFAENGTCFKGNKCKLSHDKLREDGHTKQQEAVLTEGRSEIEDVAVGDRIYIFVTHVASPLNLYGHIDTKNKKELDPHYGSIKLREFSKHSQQVDFVKGLKTFQVSPALNELVIFLQPNKFWCRGRIVAFISDKEYEIFAVDYGYTSVVDYRNIRKPNPYTYSIPHQAVSFFLNDFKLNTDLSEADLLKHTNQMQSVMELSYHEAIVKNRFHDEIWIDIVNVDNILLDENLIRNRAEHNDGEISTLVELTLHQEGIDKIEHIQNWCRNIEILFLQANIINRIENLHKLKRLKYLNLAVNNIEVIENLQGCESLEKLDLTLNFIGDIFSLKSLCNNYNLKQLYLTGNPCANYNYYRPYVVFTLSQLRELDCVPILPSETIKALQLSCKLVSSIAKDVETYKELRHEQKMKYLKLKSDHDVSDVQFWNTVTESCPEIRTEITLRSLKNRVDRKFGGDDNSKSSKRTPRSLFNQNDEPLNINEAQVEYELDFENSTDIVLKVKIFRYLESSLISYDMHPNYITIWIKGKIFQMKLPEEIQVEKSTVHRSQVSGLLTIRMPKLINCGVVGKNCATRITDLSTVEESLRKVNEYNKTREYLEIGGRRTTIYEKIVIVNNSAQFVDNEEVPPLE